MKLYEKMANNYLVQNDLDYQKYGDKRKDRSSYDTRMNYEIADMLINAYEMGFIEARDLMIQQIETEIGHEDLSAIGADPFLGEEEVE